MPKPTNPKAGRPHLGRDGQQWIFDLVVKDTGRIFHWWSDVLEPLPKSVKSHKMISKQMGKRGLKLQAQADAEYAVGHRRMALELYWAAAQNFSKAQLPIFEVNDEKRFLYTKLDASYERVMELSPYKIERIDLPWGDSMLSGYLHLCPGVEKAPLVFFMPGCDTTCESAPNPTANLEHSRGMHVFSFDGPGQGVSLMRGIPLTPTNYEEATKAMIDVLAERPEIDEEQIVVFGAGMGCYWAVRHAAIDKRVKAVVTKGCYADKYFLMNEESPRWKQLFAFLTQAKSERELDETMAAMTLDGYMEQVDCPILMVTGEYDHRDPIEEVYQLFDQVKAPTELWMFADEFHLFTLGVASGLYGGMLDWLVDRLAGEPVRHPGEVIVLESGTRGPNDPNVPLGRSWWEYRS